MRDAEQTGTPRIENIWKVAMETVRTRLTTTTRDRIATFREKIGGGGGYAVQMPSFRTGLGRKGSKEMLRSVNRCHSHLNAGKKVPTGGSGGAGFTEGEC